MTKASKFKIGQMVTSVLNKNFVAQVHTIIERKGSKQYDCCYFLDGEPKNTVFYGFEIEPIEKNGKIGFGK